MDIAKGFAGFESEEITKKINQNILSAKHLLSTNSEKIEFNAEFDKYFQLVVDEISPWIDDNPNIENPEDYAIYVDPASIQKADEFDYDTEYSTYIETGKFEVVNIKTNERIPIYPKEEKELYITPETMEMINRKKGYVYFKDIGEDCKLFNLIIDNNELTKPLYDIMNLTNKDKKDPENEFIAGAAQTMLDLCIKSNIPTSVVAGECILNRMIREVDDNGNVGFERPDFSHAWTPKYKIWTVDKCLEHNRDPFVGLSAQELKRQILSSEFIDEKWQPGYLAPLFNKHINYKAKWSED